MRKSASEAVGDVVGFAHLMCTNRARLAVVALYVCVSACDSSFLHDVPDIASPNDSVCSGIVAPTDLAVTVDFAGAHLTWSAPADGGYSVVVQLRDERTQAWGELGRSTQGRLDDPSCTTPNSQCSYRLIAASHACQTQPSAEVAAFTAPTDVLGFEARGNGETVDLRWEQNNLHVDSYQIERSTEGGAYVALGQLAFTGAATTDTVARNTAYCYRIRAVNLAGAGPAEESCTTSGAVVIANLTTEAHLDHVVLRWTDSNRFETGTVITRDVVPVGRLGPNQTTFDDTGLSPGGTYAYGFVVTSDSGDSEAYEALNVRTTDVRIAKSSQSFENGCNLQLTVTVGGAAAGRITSLDFQSEVTSGVVTVPGTTPRTVTRSISGPQGTGTFDTTWGITLTAPADTGRQVIPYRLTFSSAPTLLPTTPGTMIITEGVQPGWQDNNQAGACSGASLVTYGRVSSISAGDDHTCALTNNGRALCWGKGTDGTLGAANPGDSAAPRNLCPGCGEIDSVRSVAAGPRSTWVVSGETAYMWGTDRNGNKRARAEYGITSVRAVAAGTDFACTANINAVACIGANGKGELGRSGEGMDQPESVDEIAGTVEALDARGSHVCVIASGNLFCWGDNAHGQGGAAASAVLAPTQVLTGGTMRSLALGRDFTCVSFETGNVSCWGKFDDGVIGDSSVTADVSTPNQRQVRVSGGAMLDNVVSVAAGDRHACALRGDGSIYCWGANESGQLGRGTTTARETTAAPATRIGMPLTGVAITAGRAHTCAVAYDNTIACWGANDHRQLGDPSIEDALSATARYVSCDGLDALCGPAGQARRTALRGSGPVTLQ